MKTGIYTVLGMIGIFLVVTLFMAVSDVADHVKDKGDMEDSESLKAFMPIEPCAWTYSDDKTFKKIMVTEQAFESDQFTNIIVKGEEDDSSIKSYTDKYQFEYTYKVDDESLTRLMSGNTLLDQYEKVVLLKKPLIKDNHWSDIWVTTNGKSVAVESVIIDISEDGKRIVVESASNDKSLKVTRTLETGKGVVETRIVESYCSVLVETGFALKRFEPFEYKGFDNYMAFLGNEKISTSIDAIKTSEEGVSADDKTADDSAITPESGESDQEAEIFEDDEIDEETRTALVDSVKNFNVKWIAFINDADMTILETVVPEGGAEKIIQAYMDKEMTQKFLAMDFQRVVLKGDIANVYVYEEIERTMDESVEVLVYNWIYEVDYIDGKWLIKGYIENKSL